MAGSALNSARALKSARTLPERRKMTGRIRGPGVSKGCFLEVFEYLKASKGHSFVTPGECFFFLMCWMVFLQGSSCLEGV